ncbi:MAG: hypothetical protein [Caudoviricetes sp.]|nr:MAG: hypothetical protein [Caudoviricetes sp.]
MVDNATDANNLASTFPTTSGFLTKDGKTEYLFGYNGNSFLVMSVDPTQQGLGEKPQCNNWNDCVNKCPEVPTEPETPEKGED